jgi:mannose-6-phosphate isomerase class I
MLGPARLEPIFSARPWGSKSLAPFFPEKSDHAEPIGEAWMTGAECLFANGHYAGR